MKGVDHAAIIATRHDLGPSLAQRLKSFNSADVNTALSTNYALNSENSITDVNSLYEEIESRKDPVVKPVQTSVEQALMKATARGGRI
ncbi:MAG: hypothetical protein V3V02_08345, partial [Rhizobiaceae bacterium]